MPDPYTTLFRSPFRPVRREEFAVEGIEHDDDGSQRGSLTDVFDSVDGEGPADHDERGDEVELRESGDAEHEPPDDGGDGDVVGGVEDPQVAGAAAGVGRSEEHTSELQSR